MSLKSLTIDLVFFDHLVDCFSDEFALLSASASSHGPERQALIFGEINLRSNQCGFPL